MCLLFTDNALLGALGVVRGNVIQLVLAQGMRLVTVGIVLVLLGTVAASRMLKGMIYDLNPLDPLALMGATDGLQGHPLFPGTDC